MRRSQRPVLVVAVAMLALSACNPNSDSDTGGIQELNGTDAADNQADTEAEPDGDDGDLDSGDVNGDTDDAEDAGTSEDTTPEASDGTADGSDDASASVDEIPDDESAIDEALVQQVLDELDAQVGDLYATAADDSFGDDEIEQIATLYTNDLAGSRAGDLANPQFQELFVDEPSGPVSTVEQLRTVTLECVSADVERDMSAVFSDPGEDDDMWGIALVPAADTSNGTAWVVAHEAVVTSGDTPQDGCEALSESD